MLRLGRVLILLSQLLLNRFPMSMHVENCVILICRHVLYWGLNIFCVEWRYKNCKWIVRETGVSFTNTVEISQYGERSGELMANCGELTWTWEELLARRNLRLLKLGEWLTHVYQSELGTILCAIDWYHWFFTIAIFKGCWFPGTETWCGLLGSNENLGVDNPDSETSLRLFCAWNSSLKMSTEYSFSVEKVEKIVLSYCRGYEVVTLAFFWVIAQLLFILSYPTMSCLGQFSL